MSTRSLGIYTCVLLYIYIVCIHTLGNNVESAGIVITVYLMEYSPTRGLYGEWRRGWYWVVLVIWMTVLVYTRLTTALFLFPVTMRYLYLHPLPVYGIILTLLPVLATVLVCVMCDSVGYYVLDNHTTLIALYTRLSHNPEEWSRFMQDITVYLSHTCTLWNFYYYNVYMGYARVFGVKPLYWYIVEVCTCVCKSVYVKIVNVYIYECMV